MKIKGRAIGLVFLLVSSIFTSFVYSATFDAALLEKANTRGSVRIIARLDVDYITEGRLSSAQAIENQQARISRTQGNLLGRLASQNISSVKQFATIPYMAMEVDAAALDALSEDPEIISIEEDIPVPPTLQQSVPFINADDVQAQGFDGSGITVAILDTGVRNTHEFLDSGKVVSEACYSTTYAFQGATTLCPNGSLSQTGSGAGINCSGTGITSACSHGTHVAGIAAGTDGTPGVGVAPRANVIAIQVFSRFDSVTQCSPYPSPCVLTYPSDQILGLERVYALRNIYSIAAANMSLGGGQYVNACDLDSRKAVIDNLRSAGIATVISSGNNSYDGSVGAPGCISSAITVGATENNSNSVASYSNHANMVDMMAPGSDIFSSIATSDISYGPKNGTSMAAPHVTGAFAIMKEKFPAWSVSSIESALETTGVNVTRSGITKPRIDLLAATETTPPPPRQGDNLLLMAMPPVLAAVQARTSPPQWGARSEVCCSTSSATFYLTSSGVTKRSYIANCSTTATWEGWVTTTPGTKLFSWRLTSSNCGTRTGSFYYFLSPGKSYRFQIELEGSYLVRRVYIRPTRGVASAEKETAQTDAQTVNEITASMQLESIDQFNIPKGSFSESSWKTID